MDVTAIPASAEILDLCSYVLVHGTTRLLRRGLDQGYLVHEERTSQLRGRIDITKTAKGRRPARPEVVCQFDDLSPNVLHNQILRGTIGLLARAPKVSHGLKEGLWTTYGRLSGVDLIPITNATFRRVQLHRNNSYYSFLLFVCKLVHSLKLPDESGQGRDRFNDLLSDEKAMARVFEEFLRNFYKLKQAEFAEVGSFHLTWDAALTDATNLRLLPDMRTDVTLRSGNRTIVMDAKYYKDALQEYHGTKKPRSENLYQLLAYLRAEKAARRTVVPEGILVYPVGDNTIDANFTIDGHPIRIYTLNLAQDWQQIERDLVKLLRPQSL